MDPSREAIRGEAASASGAAVGVGSAAVAAAVSACCAGPALGPLIVSLLGASGAVAFEGLRPFTIPLLALSGLAIVVSFWVSARNAKNCSPAGPSKVARVVSRTLLWTSSAVWAAAVAAVVWAYVASSPPAKAESTAFATLGSNGEPFRTAFNRNKSAVRVVELVSPTCPFCLEGVTKIQHSLFASESSPKLVGFTIWDPMLNGKAENVPSAMALAPDPRVTHYWDGSNALGITYERLLPVASGPAWDIYMLFAPGVVWTGSNPPQPTFWMHQLPISNAPRLDADVFAQHARSLLNNAR